MKTQEEENLLAAKDFTSNVAKHLIEGLHKMNDDQLKAVISWCRAMSTTNCWWAEYQIRSTVLKFATDIQAERASLKPSHK